MHRVDMKKRGYRDGYFQLFAKGGTPVFLSHLCLFALFSNIHTLQETMDTIEKLAFASDH